ncbi:hypothetical protein D1013_16735 [Euzebyella marina]|uniref:Uncharacterized protein n=1 Tax=Euzebyella marina TaxID=1761453 RepID=A0A3G2L9H8_9FLAO|nr:hypothetical protein [Euzebyella marina]AYN68907.1 hypothetical protein D1013_16735 [Euzebyella marina]MAU72015.1 hypothetical protein [Pseudozobellia sp.]MBG47826.1 hypothetical protein [Pseudozobellia sp.]|tara:strand:- start:1220 stop:1426 length:207 start_codon:yes stop_codon:yes gene_type:complete
MEILKDEKAMKQGHEKTEFIKEEGDTHDQYILQKNTKTKTGIYIIAAFLILLIVGIIVSAVFFGSPEA